MSSSPPSGRGRPVDATLESRVYAATLALYREGGWAGFSLDAVAREAKVGKAALYRRWEGKEALIADALMECSRSFPDFGNTGTLRGDLIGLADNLLRFYLGGNGLIILRAQIEARQYPEVFGRAVTDWERRGRERARKIILQAMKRGELPAATSPALVLDMVAGTLLNHFLYTPKDRMAALEANATRYVSHVVDFVLANLDDRKANGGLAD